MIITKVLLVLMVFLANAAFFQTKIFAQTIPPIADHPLPYYDGSELKIPGRVMGVSNNFKITDSKYLNIELNSSEVINAHIESVPHMILMHLKPSTEALSATLTISNLEPNTVYYWHQDTHRSSTPFTTDLTGSYAYIQDLTSPHLVFIKPEPSTKYITDNATGGDCTTIGTWNNTTKTCTLTTNLTETIEITSNGITLDGARHLINGSGTGFGIFMSDKNDVAIKNLNVRNFAYGIFVNDSTYDQSFSNNFLINNIITNNYKGIYIPWGFGNFVSNNTVTSNTFYGLELNYNSRNTTIDGNIFNSNGVGILFTGSIQNTMTNNQLFNNSINFFIDGFSNGELDHNINITNLVDGKPIYYIQNGANTTYNDALNIGAFYCISCNNITLKDVSLNSNGQAVFLHQTINSRIENVSISAYYGIQLQSSDDNILIGNTILINPIPLPGGGVGVYFINGSDNNVISNNEIDKFAYNIRIDQSNENEITRNTITNSPYNGLYLSGLSNRVFNNNFVNNATQVVINSGQDNIFNLALPAGGNYWSDFDTPNEGCNDSNNNNICDNPHVFAGAQDDYPWNKPNGWLTINNFPSVSDLAQYKSSLVSQDEIDEGGITTESHPDNPLMGIVGFKAQVSDPNDDPVKLEIEIKPFNQAFDGLNPRESDLVTSGSEASVKSLPLSPGQYHWRARVVDIHGNASSWQEFENPGNVDFIVKLVPLYTQNSSQYPSFTETNNWRIQQYAGGKGIGSCGNTIEQCGCAITSAVMVMRYHGITSAQSNNVDPLKLNDWLNSHDGYTSSGGLWMGKVAEYSSYLVNYDYANHGNIDNGDGKEKYRYANLAAAFSILDGYLANNRPAILYVRPGRGGINRQHFLVADNKLAGPIYNIKDPYWYNTRNLNEATNQRGLVRGYENGFDGLRLFYPGNISSTVASFALSSPAEFLITDPNGNRIGINPATGTKYDEIIGASYSREGIDNPDESAASTNHQDKIVHIPNPINGNYNIKVMGTREGSYAVTSSAYDSNGNSHSEILQGNTINGLTTEYIFEFDDVIPSNIDISPNDQAAPTTTLSIVGTQINGWYASDALVTLLAADNVGGVGIYKTEYSLDNGISWNTYTSPFTPSDGSGVVIKYRSKDFVGNSEAIQTSPSYQIDQTPPEAKISFNTLTGFPKIEGLDNLSTPTVTQIDPENYTVIDHVGHILQVNLTATHTAPTLINPTTINIKVNSLQYNSNPTINLPATNISYEYSIFPITILKELLTSLPSLSVAGIYNPIDNTTIIYGTQNLTPISETLSGVKIIKLVTKKGNLEVEY